jgi:hypothetical protein
MLASLDAQFSFLVLNPRSLISVTYEDSGDATMASPSAEHDDQKYPCIIKVTDGEGFKMSTRVSAVITVTLLGICG